MTPSKKPLFKLLRSLPDRKVPAPFYERAISDEYLSGDPFSLWVATGQCPQLTECADYLAGRVKRDKSWMKSDRFSRLAGGALTRLKSSDVGKTIREHEDMEFPGDRSIGISILEGLVLKAEFDVPVGYVAYYFNWMATDTPGDRPRLEVLIDEVWIEPRYRGQNLGAWMAEQVSECVLEHLLWMDRDWPGQRPARFDMVIAGDVYSASGADFIKACHREYAFNRVEEDPELARRYLLDGKLTYEVRW